VRSFACVGLFLLPTAPLRRNRNFLFKCARGSSIALTAGHVDDPKTKSGMRIIGLPYGAKPRLFQSYVCTQVIKQQSPVIPVERSMTAMMQELGLKVTGGREGTIRSFKEQITRFAACKFTIIGPGPRGSRRHIHAEPFKSFDVWFPPSPD
jgi:hypothetical protein